MPNNVPPTALADFILLNEEIAALVRARIPLEANLERIGAELPGKSGELAERIGRRMQTGENLAQAMEAECGSMPPAYHAAMVAGVESGQLGKALEAVVESATRIDKLRRVSALALVYPLILVGIVFPLLTLMLVLLVPRFSWLKDSRFKPIEWLANTPNIAPILAFAVPAIIIVTAVIWWWRSGRLGYQPRFGLLGLLTGSSRVRRWSQARQFAETMLLLLDRGVPLPQSLRLAGDASSDRRLRAAALDTAQRIERGSTASSFSASPADGRASDFPVLIRLAMHHADNGRLLTASLRQARTMYRDRAIRAAEWYAEYLPILLTVAIGGTFTVAFALFVFWPYVSMLHELAQWKGR